MSVSTIHFFPIEKKVISPRMKCPLGYVFYQDNSVMSNRVSKILEGERGIPLFGDVGAVSLHSQVSPSEVVVWFQVTCHQCSKP